MLVSHVSSNILFEKHQETEILYKSLKEII